MARSRTGRPTIVDVAALAGVSVATASRSLNGRDDVHPKTRQAVAQAAERLNFATRRRAAEKRSAARAIGLLTSDPGGRFSMAILAGAEDALGAGGIEVLLCSSRNDPIRERHYIATLIDRDVDGIIVVGDRTNPRVPLSVSAPIPVVYAFAPSLDEQDMSFAPDDRAGGRIATRHVIDLGRRRIAHITGPEEWSSARERAEGSLAELRERGLEPVGGVRFGAGWTQHWGRTAMTMLLRDHPDIDAVVCGCDQIAVGAMEILKTSGRSLPTDVSVVGYDNWEVFAADAQPALTTVDMGLNAIGQDAALAMFEASRQRQSAGLHLQVPRLVIRESSMPPLSAAIVET